MLRRVSAGEQDLTLLIETPDSVISEKKMAYFVQELKGSPPAPLQWSSWPLQGIHSTQRWNSLEPYLRGLPIISIAVRFLLTECPKQREMTGMRSTRLTFMTQT